MALQYGMNITASDMKSLLEKNDKQKSGVRTWRQLFGNASLGFNAQSDALTTDYSGAIAAAYKANFEQNNAILGAGLGVGATRELLSQSRKDLHTAYETYVRNYGNDLNTAAKTYSNEVSAIDTALTERATNFSNLYSSAYKYITDELYGATFTDTTGEEESVLDYLTEHGMQWLYEKDEEGNPTDQLRSWNSVAHELFNADNSLNDKGTAFFDQIFNTLYEPYLHSDGERDIYSFDEWLSNQEETYANYDATNLPGMAKNGKALRDWWVSQDEFNYNFAGTNKGTAQIMAGLESTDNLYNKTQYLGTSAGKTVETYVLPENTYASKLENYKKKYDYYQNKVKKDSWKPSAEASIITAENNKNDALAELNKEFTKYVTNIFTDIESKYSDTLSANIYEKFKQSNSSLYTRFKNLIAAAAYSEQNEAELKLLINDFNAALRTFMIQQSKSKTDDRHDTRKRSGF